jgi:hypothetical protein
MAGQDRRDRTNDFQFDSFTATKLAEWQATGAEVLLSSEFATFLERLQEFSLDVRARQFESVMARFEGGRQESETAAEVINAIAHSLCLGVPGRARDIINKSLQETLFYCTAGDPDLPPSVFGERLESFLRRGKGRGLIAFFLKIHLFNLIWIDLHEHMQADGGTSETLKKRSKGVENLCHSVVYSCLRSERSPSELDSSAVSNLIYAVERNLTNRSNSNSLFRLA